MRQLNEDNASNMSFQQNSCNSPLIVNHQTIQQQQQIPHLQNGGFCGSGGHHARYNSTFENNNYKRSIVIPQALKNTINKIDQELNESEEMFVEDDEGGIMNLNSEAARRLLLLECNRITTGAPKNRSATMLNLSGGGGGNHMYDQQNDQASSSPLPHNLHSNHNSVAYQLSSSSSLPPPQQRNVHIASSQSFNFNNNSGNFGRFSIFEFFFSISLSPSLKT